MMKRSGVELLFILLAVAFLMSGCGSGGGSGGSGSQSGPKSFSELLQLTASDAADGDSLGYSVSISGDYAIAGAIGEGGTGGTLRGAAYIYHRDQGGANNWGQVKKLSASDAMDLDVFGWSVSIDGDYAVVGAEGVDDLGSDYGAAYVFYRNHGGADSWGEVKKLIASDAQNSDYFGYSVSISGDNVVVGAPYEDGGGTNYGAAYVFNRNQGGTDNWGQVKKLIASDAASSDELGTSVSISGDYAIAGAYRKNSNRGAVYVYYRDQGGANNWGEVKKLTASDPVDGDSLGISVSISGDDIIAGADNKNTGRGAAYVFNRNQGGTGNWGEVRQITASDAEDYDYFGYSVSISGDYAISGAYWEDGAGIDRGAAYVYYRDQGGNSNWGEVTKLTASDAAQDDLFGWSVSISGGTAIVGAAGVEGAGATDRGAAYIFE